MLNRSRDEWLKRVHNQKESPAWLSVRRRCHCRPCWNMLPTNDWEMFTCSGFLRDVEGTVDLVLDRRATGLTAD